MTWDRPDQRFFGSDSFHYRTSDGLALSPQSATVRIDVQAVGGPGDGGGGDGREGDGILDDAVTPVGGGDGITESNKPDIARQELGGEQSRHHSASMKNSNEENTGMNGTVINGSWQLLRAADFQSHHWMSQVHSLDGLRGMQISDAPELSDVRSDATHDSLLARSDGHERPSRTDDDERKVERGREIIFSGKARIRL